jgi:hypothetical protein
MPPHVNKPETVRFTVLRGGPEHPPLALIGATVGEGDAHRLAH